VTLAGAMLLSLWIKPRDKEAAGSA
jgi:hypothetical protein